MAVKGITTFDDWYVDREEDSDGCLKSRGLSPEAESVYKMFTDYKREMDARVANYDKLLMLADAEVISPKPDLPNVSSGETSGMILRMARNLVQHTPNVHVTSKFDDDRPKGIIVEHLLKSAIIGDEHYSNDMQQHLFASTKNALTLGFDCVVPVLYQDAAGGWKVLYDSIFYRDVFPEPGARDIRRANIVFIRRYLTKGDVKNLIRNQVTGWDVAALKDLLKSSVPPRQTESVDHQSRKHRSTPEGYEIITMYSNTGEPFLTFSATTRNLLRIEKNKHPLKEHPVHFLILENDSNQPLGKSQVERILGRQEFQDLMLNGAMKLYYSNINPPIIGYGTTNAPLNLSPGKYNQIGNPNARIETFERNTQTLLQFNSISQANAGNMIQQIGAADQQMASQNTGGMMSQTPQGVEAQQAMVDITTNNYQKAIENFFSKYCSYALTIFFQELKSIKEITPTADARKKLLHAGLPKEEFDAETGAVKIDFSELAVEYFVRTVPGSLVELEEEKQLRILNELFIPLSQSMPALAAAGDQAALQKASAAMQYIVEKQLELSGSMHANELQQLMTQGPSDAFTQQQTAIATFEDALNTTSQAASQELTTLLELVKQQQEQLSLLTEAQQALMQRLGVPAVESTQPAEVLQV